MTFGYDADVVSVLDTASSNTLRNHGAALAQDLARKRTRSNSVFSSLRRYISTRARLTHDVGRSAVDIRRPQSGWASG